MKKRIEGDRPGLTTFIPDNIEDAQWYQVSKDIMIFGVKESGSNVISVDHKFAMIKRRQDGAFEYALNKTAFSGQEPSKEQAIKKVNDLYGSAIALRDALQ